MLLIISIFLWNFLLVNGKFNPDVLLNVEQLIKKHGYPVELHEVVTKDAYILNMYRIPRGIADSNEPQNKSVVLFLHGQGGSPQNFIALGSKHAAAYYFANRGFDVWLFCSRGVECQNPRKHISLDWNKDPLYWNFSVHEIGIYDLPASIDLIKYKTGQKKIFIVGHSTGDLASYVLMSEKPAYNKKIKLHVSYAPLVVMKEVDYPFIQVLFRLSNIFKNIYSALGMYEFIPYYLSDLLTDTLRKMCADSKWFKACKAALWSFGSHISALLEDDIVPLALHVFPRYSIKHIIHFMQLVNEGEFRKYDYGVKKNLAIYGKKLPPAYNLSSCTVPTALFYGALDSFTMPEDILETKKLLPNIIFNYEVGPRFVHLDFIFAKNASHLLYQPTVKLLKDFDAGITPPKEME